jgi:hypothetical protein
MENGKNGKRGRPRRPVEEHLILGSYRRDRHGALPGAPAEPVSTPVASPPEIALREEILQWRLVFETGHNWFDDVPGLGADPAVDRRGWDAADGPYLAAVRAAWARLGVAFMAQWVPEEEGDTVWALRAFGDPTQPLKRPTRLRR